MIALKQKGKIKRRILSRAWISVLPFVGTASTLMLLPLLFAEPGSAQGLQMRKARQVEEKSTHDSQAFSAIGVPSAVSSMSKAPVKGYLRHADRRPDPEAGVQLIETIFNRVMNIPQVALNKSTGSQMIAQNLKLNNNAGSNQSSQSVDYKLAIRPKETGKVYAAPPPSLQIAQALPSVNRYDRGVTFGASLGGGGGASGYLASNNASRSGLVLKQQSASSLPSTSTSFLGDEDSLAAPSASMEQWRGNSRIAKNEAAAEGAKGASSADAFDKPGVWEDISPGASQGFTGSRRAQAPSASSLGAAGFAGLPPVNMGKYVHQPGDNQYQQQVASNYGGNARGLEMATGFSSEPSKKKASDLSSSVNRLYKLSRNLEESQNSYMDKEKEEKADKTSMTETKGRLLSHAKMPPGRQVQLGDSKVTFYNAPREVQVIDERPVVRDFREAPDAQMELPTLNARARRSSSYGAASPSSSSSGLIASNSSSVAGVLQNKISGSLKPQLESDAANELRGKDKLAMLPPNVVTGIPLGNVTLGKPETQVISSLAQIGKIKQQKVKNWTVYSWTKKGSDGAESLQLFFRHGMLDAIRIFDSSLVGTDFGVSPGDKLETVKERFGEPSFLLAEPGSSGKNYVYPISQVGFQLVRSNDSSPQVVSVLIFSVK